MTASTNIPSKDCVLDRGHDGSFTLSNTYLRVRVDATGRVREINADAHGRAEFSGNLIPDGMTLITKNGETQMGRLVAASSTPERASVSIEYGVPATVQVEMLLSPDARCLSLAVQSRSHDSGVWSFQLTLPQKVLVAQFESGVVQSISGTGKEFRTDERPVSLYTMGADTGCFAIQFGSNPANGIVLVSERGPDQWTIDMPLSGQYTADEEWRSTPREFIVGEGSPSSIALKLYPNTFPFPAYALPAGVQITEDLVARLMAIYGSAAAVLGSFHHPGSAYPTLALPERVYGPLYSFFDPDAWSTVTTLSYSGDSYLQSEARKVLEASEGAMTAEGQIPHHFNGQAGSSLLANFPPEVQVVTECSAGPTFVAISGACQTGPNIFWILAAHEYVVATGDVDWLRAHYASLHRALSWVLSHFDERRSLLKVSGPLFIDTFRREGFTLDTNVAAVHLLDLFAGIARFCDDTRTADQCHATARRIATAVQSSFWDGQDHFITSRDEDWQPFDRVDYDGNYAAIAFGVATPEQSRAILHRIDNGPHTHPNGRGTWVSERRYEKEDCFVNNDGDSDCAMARIWWIDMLAHRRIDDAVTFNTLYENIRGDLLQHVWMTERYDAAGKLVRAAGYHEYPEIVAMLQLQARYGLQIRLDRVTLHPFGIDRYQFAAGGIRIDYSPEAIELAVPGDFPREVWFQGLEPGAKYIDSSGIRRRADDSGVIVIQCDGRVSVRLSAES